MNFFGHAIVATWQSPEPGFVLGAMLPDFATMIGARVPEARHADITAGVAFHHATDRVFHEASTFRGLQADARKTLREMGLPRPSALAVGHIGVEILLDSALARDTDGRVGYLEALREAHPTKLGALVSWADPVAPASYARLVAGLAEGGVPDGAAAPDAAAWRIARALSSRPRLRLEPDGERIVRIWADTAALIVAERARALMNEVTAGLVLGGADLSRRPRTL